MRRPSLIVCVLIAIMVVVHVAFAVTYFYLEGTAHLDEVTPYVQWYRWSDCTPITTKIGLTINLVKDQWTIIDNATHGIANYKNGPQECAFFIEAISIPDHRPTNFTVEIYNATKVKARWTTSTWTNLGEAYAVPFTMYALEKATMRIIVKASSDAVDCDVAFKLRVPPEGT